MQYYTERDIMDGMSKKTKTRSILDAQLLAAFKASRMTRFELAKRSTVAYAAIHGWVAGTRGLTLGTASRLCVVLGLELGPMKSKRK